MKSLITTLKNIFSIKELKDRILYTLLLLLIFRIGTEIVLPGVRADVLKSATNANANDLLGLLNIFTGGAFNNASILALGIMPYITASIVVQLLGFAVPYFQRLQSKEGESGRKKLNQITRLLTVAITLVQGGAYLTYVNSLGAVDTKIPTGIFWLCNSIILSTGTVFSMWLGERITDKGIGNGISLLIQMCIIARLPQAFAFEFSSQASNNNLLIFILELALLFAVIMLTILVVQGVRKIPVTFANRMVGRTSKYMPGEGARDYIPLKLNAAGVMPIIFAQALMFLPATVAQFATKDQSALASSSIFSALNDFMSIPYNIIYFVMVVLFTYIYTALIVNSQQYTDYLKRQNAFIPGIKPGSHTNEFIDSITSRITLPGAIFLGIIAIFPAIAGRVLGINHSFAVFFGGTSLLILVGVALDTLQMIESYLLMRKYDGLVESGKIQGRSSSGINIGAGY